eukprot:CAMPEP_0114250642 /NCGR_PEP_ID=MMETSP0058-20121206/14816_1 /TAXON_ID=36894 /ORGANISM="Pyramimonas parkeae, CCMP726" /LENGTH=276 /DNA_ID=CAMNT_0001364331 /DNA_START=733 /DNA_END=1563 /DNA_ORIENTATION=+
MNHPPANLIAGIESRSLYRLARKMYGRAKNMFRTSSLHSVVVGTQEEELLRESSTTARTSSGHSQDTVPQQSQDAAETNPENQAQRTLESTSGRGQDLEIGQSLETAEDNEVHCRAHSHSATAQRPRISQQAEHFPKHGAAFTSEVYTLQVDNAKCKRCYNVGYSPILRLRIHSKDPCHSGIEATTRTHKQEIRCCVCNVVIASTHHFHGNRSHLDFRELLNQAVVRPREYALSRNHKVSEAAVESHALATRMQSEMLRCATDMTHVIDSKFSHST